MIKNYEESKSQLKEVSEVINGFKSAAVHLRIIEIVFGMETEDYSTKNESDTPASTKRKTAKRKSTKKLPKKATTKKSGKKASGQGAVVTLIKLVEEGFFSKPKSIGDIVEHCEHNLARIFKANEFSGKLGRLVRDDELKRSKNAENQYEYQIK